MVMDIKAHMQENAAKGGGGLFLPFYVGFKIVGFTSTPTCICTYNAHVVVQDSTVIIIHVHISGPVDGSKRHTFQLISLAY